MKSIPMSLWCIFPEVKLTKVEERQTGRSTCSTSEQHNVKSGSALWMSLVEWGESLKQALGMSTWGTQLICKTERRCCKYWWRCFTTVDTSVFMSSMFPLDGICFYFHFFNVNQEQIFKWQEHSKPALSTSSKIECGPELFYKILSLLFYFFIYWENKYFCSNKMYPYFKMFK